MTKSRGILGPRHKWTEKELVVLREQYPNRKTADIASELGIKLQSVYQRAKALGLKKSVEFMKSPASGRTNGRQGVGSRFSTGHLPWNAGMKGLQIGGEQTQFKAGQSPYNTAEIGSYRITKDGTLQRKISNAPGNNSQRWRSVHELVWIEANGPKPAGSIVVFKPGQRTAELAEITLDKVECITLAENMKRNTLHNMPKELAELVQLRGAITRQINKRKENV